MNIKQIIIFALFGCVTFQSTAFTQTFYNASKFSEPGDFVKINYDFPTTYIYNELWVKADSIPSSSMISVSAYGQGVPESRDAHYLVAVDSDSTILFKVRVTTPSTEWISLNGVTKIKPDEWHHVYVAFSNFDKFEIWLDGVLEASNNGHTFGDLGKINTVPPLLTIATQFENGDTTDTFYGSIDEVRVWDNYRDSVQINSTMFDTLSSEYYSSEDSGLAGYWRFDEFEDLGVNSDGADDFRDFSTWSRHGDSNGSIELVPSNIVSVEQTNQKIPNGDYLSNNYPNPFNPSTIISFLIPELSFVSLKIFNSLGEEIETLVTEELNVGNYKYEWNAKNLTSGIYFYELRAGKFSQVKKMVLLK
jgi:Concanavalin A-like lectin/glucanases superfamily/Secretion system C-terminal sorting domain